MTKLSSPSELPKLISGLERDGFYGEIRLTFRHGEICRIVVEHSQVFTSTKGNPPNARHNR